MIAAQSSSLISLWTNCCSSYVIDSLLLWVLWCLVILYVPFFMNSLKIETKKPMSFFSPNMDAIVSFLFGPFYFFHRDRNYCEGGKVKWDEFCDLWISGLLPSECLAMLPVSLFSPSCSSSWVFMVHNCRGKLASQMKSISRTTCIQ